MRHDIAIDVGNPFVLFSHFYVKCILVSVLFIASSYQFLFLYFLQLRHQFLFPYFLQVRHPYFVLIFKKIFLLLVTIAVCQIQMILKLIPLQNDDDGMGIRANHKNFIQSRNHSQKTPFLGVFGYNNCSVSNPNDFNTHTSSK